MKYFTKQWLNLRNQSNMYHTFTSIPKLNEYSDQYIQSLYQERLMSELNDLKAIHDQSMDNGDLTEPFDSNEFIQDFKDNYQYIINNYKDLDYPDYIVENVDPRLIALHCLPEDIFKRYDQEHKEYIEKYRGPIEEYRRVEKLQNIPEDVLYALPAYKSTLMNVENVDDNYKMYFRKYDHYQVITFKNANIITCEESIIPNESYLRITEIYRNEEGYEAHMLFVTNNEYGYFTIQFEGIESAAYQVND